MKMDDHPQYKKEEVELDENRAAARAAGGYKDDSRSNLILLRKVSLALVI